MIYPVGKKHENRSNSHIRQRETAISALARGGRQGQLSAAYSSEASKINERGLFAAVMANIAAMSRSVIFARKTGKK